jgi:hypothetical protein
MKWYKFDGYNASHQYVDDTGKILAEVSGSRLADPRYGWVVRRIDKVPHSIEGTFISLEPAKRYVEGLFGAYER